MKTDLLQIDSYRTPEAETLLKRARQRLGIGPEQRRVFIVEGAAATGFIVLAAVIALAGDWTRPLSAAGLAATIAAFVVADRVMFPVGSGWTRPTQLAFVPMLFLLPLPLVPLAVMASQLLALWPYAWRGELTPLRVLLRIGDSFYAIGPVVVLIAFGVTGFHWTDWPILALAFAAQVACDLASGLGRTWFAERILPSDQVLMAWIYVTDACLSCVGLLVAASAAARPGLVLLVVPLLGLFGIFARERQQRLDGTLELGSAYRGTALLLGDVVEGDHHYTGVHSREVVDLSLAVADSLGLGAEQRQSVEFAALLHDVGKIRVPKDIINKPGRLTDEEWLVMKRHTIEGEAMLRQVGGLLARVGRMVRASHERYDGLGYPDGLAGAEIPIEARIVCACDAFSAMTSDRSYRPGRSAAEAVAELRRCSGTQFDPVVVAALVAAVTARPPAAAPAAAAPAPLVGVAH